MRCMLKLAAVLFLALYLLPLGTSAALYAINGQGAGWLTADRSSAGLLPPAATHQPAVLRVYAARTVRWRGIFAVHCWVVFKEEGAAGYTRYDYTAWGNPVRLNGFEPDGRWFGHAPETVFAADGAAAAAMIPKVRQAIAGYAFSNPGDYRAWPGPNSNTFVAAVLEDIPTLHAALPPLAIGKDFPHDGRWFRLTPSGTGIRLNFGGYLGLTLAWEEGLEFSLLGAVAGFDLRRPAIKLPGLGRFGFG